MITQVIFWMVICTLGYCIGRIAIGLDAKYAYCMSLPLGIGFSAFVTMILAISNIGLGPRYSLLIVGGGVLCIYFVRLRKRSSQGTGSLNLKSTVGFLAFLAGVTAASIILSKYNFVQYTSDSFNAHEGFGRVIALSKQFDLKDPTLRVGVTFAPMLALVNATGFDFGIKHLYTLYPLCTVFLIAVVIVFSTDVLRLANNKRICLLICLGFSVVLLVLNRNVIIHSFTALPNLLGSLFLSAGLLCFYRWFFDRCSSSVYDTGKGNSGKPFLLCASAMFAFSAMTRAELYYYILIPFFFITIDRRAVIMFSLVYVPLCYTWVAFRFLSFGYCSSCGPYGKGSEIDFLAGAIYAIIFSCGMLKLASGWLKRNRYFMVAYIVFSIILFSLFLYFGSSIFSLFKNLLILLFVSGNWGLFWYVVIPFSFVALLLDNFEGKSMFIVLSLGFVLLEITIYAVYVGGIHTGNPMRSENRILLNILPFLVFYVVNNFAARLSFDVSNCNTGF